MNSDQTRKGILGITKIVNVTSHHTETFFLQRKLTSTDQTEVSLDHTSLYCISFTVV